MKILQASALVILGLFMAAGCTINIGSSSPNRIVSVETPLQQVHSSQHLENVEVTWKAAPSDSASTTEFEGEWEGEIDSETIVATFKFEENPKESYSSNSQVFFDDGVLIDSKSQGKTFEVEREAGRLVLTDSKQNKETVRRAFFQPNPTLAGRLGEVANDSPTRIQLFEAFVHNLTVAELVEFKTADQSITYDDILTLKRNGISGKNVSDLRKISPKFTTQKIINLHRNGVPADFVAEVAVHRPTMETEDFIDLRRNGVPSEYVAALTKAGCDYSTDNFISLRRNGIPEEYIQQFKAAGYSFSVEEYISLRRNGIPVEYAAAMKQSGKTYPVDDLIDLRRNGVPEEFIGELQSLGYDYSIDEMIQLRRNGVSTEYLREIQVANRKQLPANDVIELRRRGVPSEVVRSLRAAE